MRTGRFLALFAGLLLIAACTSEGGGADGRVTLRFQSLAWQQESVEVNRELVEEWNATHPDVKVEYVQGSWDSVHDQLLTSFEGGEAPDIIHDASDDLADFAYGGYLADLTGLLTERLKTDIPRRSWDTVTFGDGIYGVPFLQEPRVLVANATWLEEAGVRIPTPEHPWTWPEFRRITERLSGDGRYGVAWPLKEPVSATLNLSLSAGGQLFHRGADGKVTVRFEAADEVVPRTIHDQANTDDSASPTTLGSGGSDTLPGFFGGRYAMVPLGFSYRQQITQQAPEGFRWQVLPAPAGAGGLTQGVSPQTLSGAAGPPPTEAAAPVIAIQSPRTARTRRRPPRSSTSCSGPRTWCGSPSATGCCPPAPRR
jgi:ABC-type glycerol-3-phosphate transport system substrate-binding protein